MSVPGSRHGVSVCLHYWLGVSVGSHSTRWVWIVLSTCKYLLLAREASESIPLFSWTAPEMHKVMAVGLSGMSFFIPAYAHVDDQGKFCSCDREQLPACDLLAKSNAAGWHLTRAFHCAEPKVAACKLEVASFSAFACLQVASKSTFVAMYGHFAH
jgi:hypothetical protein